MELGFNPWYVGGVLKVAGPRYRRYNQDQVSILGMLEGVLKGPHHYLINLKSFLVSILGMLEGVLKGNWDLRPATYISSFNPWYVGGGVKSRNQAQACLAQRVSILGMLEGVLKGLCRRPSTRCATVSILGMLEKC